MITLRDVKPGMCWRFTSDTAPDKRPTLAYDRVVDDYPPCLPKGWDAYNTRNQGDQSDFWEANKDEPVQILMHYSKAPEGRPVEDFEAILASDVKDGQWYVGPWTKPTAESVATALNRKLDKSSQYEGNYGPSGSCGWVVVRALPDIAPVVLSCVDPFKDLRDAITGLETWIVDGLTGKDCVQRFERGQQTESIAWTGLSHVCTNAECGLTGAQIQHARGLWTLMLRLRVFETKAAANAEREAMSIVCDPMDEV